MSLVQKLLAVIVHTNLLYMCLLRTSAPFPDCTTYLLKASHGVQVIEHYKEFAEAHGQGDMAAVAAASEQWAADFDLEAVPDIPQADLPPQPPKVKNCRGTQKSAWLVGPLSGW